MADTLYVCVLTHKDGKTSRFVSSRPDVFVEWPPEWPDPESPGRLDAFMAGEQVNANMRMTPTKYHRQWFDDAARADWCRGVAFSEKTFDGSPF